MRPFERIAAASGWRNCPCCSNDEIAVQHNYISNEHRWRVRGNSWPRNRLWKQGRPPVQKLSFEKALKSLFEDIGVSDTSEPSPAAMAEKLRPQMRRGVPGIDAFTPIDWEDGVKPPAPKDWCGLGGFDPIKPFPYGDKLPSGPINPPPLKQVVLSLLPAGGCVVSETPRTPGETPRQLFAGSVGECVKYAWHSLLLERIRNAGRLTDGVR